MKNYILGVFTLFLLIACGGKNQNNTSSNTATQVTSTTTVNNKSEVPVMELVFCLDATGSMRGLLNTAKEKIWDIVTVLSQSNPTPDIRLGMVFYRDIQDEFVTKVYPLTVDIDSIYSELLLIEAQGGGDSPESVNQALNEAVTQMGWKEGTHIYRTIFLVGDCPPHMDYKKEVKYPTSCKIANEKGIVINTIKLGVQCSGAIAHFKAIAEATNGEYQQLGQNADDVVIQTPYDDSISYYSNRIDASKLYYGSHLEQEAMEVKKQKALDFYEKSSSNAVASRAKFNVSKAGKKNLYGKKELVEDFVSNKIDLIELDEKELPEKIRKINKSERAKYLQQLKKDRTHYIAKLKVLTEQREAFIAKGVEKDSTRVLFSKEISKVLKKQAKRKGIKNFK